MIHASCVCEAWVDRAMEGMADVQRRHRGHHRGQGDAHNGGDRTVADGASLRGGLGTHFGVSSKLK